MAHESGHIVRVGERYQFAVHTLAQIGPVKYDLLTRKHHRLGNLRRYSLGMNGKYET